MRTLKAVLVALVVAFGCAALTEPAIAGGRHGGHGHGHAHYSVGIWGPGYWGGYWGPGYWGRGYWPGYWGGYWGPGYWGGGYWGYAPPAVAVVPQEPRVYIERDEAQAPAAAPQGNGQWWYWCASSSAYYPYVSTCSEGWQRVPPQPAQAPR
jgi:hypothetical protein